MTDQTKTVSSVHGKTITLMNTQYLWSPEQELHKNQTVNILAWCTKGVTVIHPDCGHYGQLISSMNERISFH